MAAINGGLNVAIANGGPGNGVVGGAAALVLGLIALTLGGLVLVRSRRYAGNSPQARTEVPPMAHADKKDIFPL